MLRAHHGLCLSFFQGKGYSREFVENMLSWQKKLAEDPRVRIVACSDVICSACPNLRAGICTSAEKVAKYDRQVLERCGIAEGEEMSFREFERLVREKILLPGKREEVCGDCQWSDICR